MHWKHWLPWHRIEEDAIMVACMILTQALSRLNLGCPYTILHWCGLFQPLWVNPSSYVCWRDCTSGWPCWVWQGWVGSDFCNLPKPAKTPNTQARINAGGPALLDVKPFFVPAKLQMGIFVSAIGDKYYVSVGRELDIWMLSWEIQGDIGKEEERPFFSSKAVEGICYP